MPGGKYRGGHYTWRAGTYGKKKVRYTREQAIQACAELSLKFGNLFVIYPCMEKGPLHYHVGQQRGMGLPKHNNQIYEAFGNMVAALMRGKTTPPLQDMIRPKRDDSDLQT